MNNVNNVQNVPVKKKQKRPLRTPSHILRLCIIWCFVICMLLLSFPFFNATYYITKDLGSTINYLEADLSYPTQDEVDSMTAELRTALDGLEKKPDDEVSDTTVEYNVSVSTLQLDWTYHFSEDIDAVELLNLIEEAKSVERNLYTDESVEKLNIATLKAQKCLCATATITQSALQMIFGGNIAEMYGHEDEASTVASSLLAYGLAIIPVIGFFAMCFDKKKHIKHVISVMCCILGVLDIFFLVFPCVDTGSILTLVMYIIITVLNVFSIYAKQQEDYIVKHPELESEFTEKHPHFVKALINQKSFGNVKVPSKSEQTRMAAKNAKKHRNKK